MQKKSDTEESNSSDKQDDDSGLRGGEMDKNDLFEYGKSLLKKRKYEESIAAFEKAINMGFRSAEIYFRMGDAYFRARSIEGHYTKAIECFDIALKKNQGFNNNAKLFNLRGACYFENKQFYEAIRDYTRAIKLKPDRPNYFFNRSTAYFLINEFDKAIADMDIAISLKQDDPDYYKHRALCYLQSGDATKAIRDYTKTIELDPKQKSHYYSRAGAYLYAEKVWEAIEDYNKAISLGPNRITYYLSKALACLEGGHEYEDDLRDTFADMLERLQDTERESLETLIKANSKLAKGKDYVAAKKLYKQFITRGCKKTGYRVFAHSARGFCYEKLKKNDKAKIDYKQALRLRPMYAFPYIRLKRLGAKKAGSKKKRTSEPQRSDGNLYNIRISYEDIEKFLSIDIRELRDIKLIGKGGFKKVVLSDWLGIKVAVCKLRKQSNYTRDEREQFAGEVNIMSLVRHPNIVQFYGIVTNTTKLAFVAEYCSGGDLYRLLHEEKKKLSVRRMIEISLDIALGLNYLHSRSIVHRDLKSQNILFDEHGVAKITDFGLAKNVINGRNMMSNVGTPYWMAPEILKGDRYGPKVDIYSFGIILYEICFRKLPYASLDPKRLTHEIARKGRRPSIPKTGNAILGRLYNLIRECWDQNPKNRPAAREIIIILKDLYRKNE